MFPGHKPRVDWSPTPSRKKPRLPNSGDLSPNPPSPASLPGLSIDLLSEIEPDLDPIEDWDPQQAPSSTGPDPIEDWSPENEASSHACPPQQVSTPGPASDSSPSWEVLGAESVIPGFQPCTRAAISVTNLSQHLPKPVPKMRGRRPVQAPHSTASLLLPLSAWPQPLCKSPRSGPVPKHTVRTLGGPAPPACPKKFQTCWHATAPLPKPPPKPAPASAYLNKPKPLPAQPPATPNPASSSTPEIEAPSKRQEPIVHQQRLGPPRLQTMLAKEDARKLECNRIWLLLLDKLRDTSSLWTETTQSLTPERLRVRAISAYAASSLEAYLSRCTRFLDFLQAHNIAFSTLSLVELADYLEAAFASLAQDRDVCQISPKTTLKALSWLSRMAQVQHLLELLSNPLISTYRIDIKPRDRKEALPIPMACIVSWERLVCKSSTGTQMVLLLGAFLLAYHACLRFGDLQRIRLSSLSLTTQALRGICWTTKTSRSGQPFAVTLTGISGRGPSTSWCLAYLTRLHASWLATERFWGSSSEPDFMLPILPNWANPSQAGVAFQSPMSYTQALPALRSALQLHEEASPGALDAQEALNFTLHGLKVGLLSPAKQLRPMTISHMLPIIPRFMYAREFETQAAIDDDANEPSSPSPSRSSGEQSASKHASDESTLDEDSYSSSEEDSPHKAPQPRHPKAPLDPATAIVANGHWGAVHLAHPISDTHWRTACGIVMGDAGVIMPEPDPARMCRHKACRLALDAFQSLPSE